MAPRNTRADKVRLRNVATSTSSPPTGPAITPKPGNTTHTVRGTEGGNGGNNGGNGGNNGGSLPGTGSPASPGLLAAAFLAIPAGAGLIARNRRQHRS